MSDVNFQAHIKEDAPGEQVTRRMRLTILYTSPENRAKDLPSIGWLTLEDEVSDGLWCKQIALGKPEVLAVWGCPLVQKIASKAAPSDDDERFFELTEKAFKRCEKLLSAMMPLKWEFNFQESSSIKEDGPAPEGGKKI